MKALGWMRRLLRSERGNVIVIGATTMPLLIGAGALALDTVQLSLWKRQLQRAADSSALAGARALVQAKDVTGAAQRDLQLNNQVPLLGAPVIEPPPAGGSWAGNGNAVRVILKAKQNLPFWSFFTDNSPELEVAATAAIISTGNFCLIALEDRPMTGINMTGNSNLNLGCGIATNASGETAIDAGGSSTMKATPIIAVGGLDAENSKFSGSTVLPYSPEQKDPFADRADPSIATASMDCSSAWGPGDGPGCYSSMNVNETVTLPAGTYYIKNGNADFGTKARVTGTEVAIVFTGDGDNIGKFDMSGQAEITLSAPKSGPYQGIVFFRDDDRVTMDLLKINGGQELKIEGAMYFPHTKLWFNGGSDVSAKCLQIVAQQMEFKGGANITNDCSAGYGSSFAARFVRLVE